MDKRVDEIKKFWFLSEGEEQKVVRFKKELEELLARAIQDMAYLIGKLDKKK